MSAPPSPAPPAASIDALVARYLEQKGYAAAAAALARESAGDNPQHAPASDALPAALLLHTDPDAASPAAWDTSYRKLRKWIEDSLDKYKTELRHILFPLFVHTFLELVSRNFEEHARAFYDNHKLDHSEDHSADLARLSSVTDAAHVKENELAQLFRSNKYGLVMSQYAFDLLLGFLQSTRLANMLRIVNQYISIEVVPELDNGQPQDIGITGHTSTKIAEVNTQKIMLGIQPWAGEAVDELERRLQADTEKHAPLLAILDELKRGSDNAPSEDRTPYPPKKLVDVEQMYLQLQDLSNRAKLDPAHLPSVCFYTFHNTYDTFNSLDLSPDLSLIVAGTQDSVIKVFSLTHTIKVRMENEQERDTKSYNATLVGHSAPVYGTAFSPCGRYLVSGSMDATVRLWSMDTMTNVVCYRGHNYPIWAVAFSPHGLYFASGSADRTARLWSVDHVHPLRIFVGHLGDVHALTFHPNGNYVVTGSADGTARLWDVHSGKTVRVFARHPSAVFAVAVSHDGKLLATADETGHVCVWDMQSAHKRFLTRVHAGCVVDVGFAHDDRLVISASADGSVAATDPAKGTWTSWKTKRTPVYRARVSQRNLVVGLGVFS